MDAERELSVDVAVVGAGLAGLSAASKLAEAGTSVAVVEARDRVGGRTLNEPIGDGKVVELGGQWVGPTQRRVMEVIGELGLETFPTHTEGANLFERRGRLRRYRGAIPRVSPLGLAETQLVITRINRMARRVDPGAPWAAADARGWDAQTFATWMRHAARTPTARDLLRLFINAVWAAEPEDLSLLHVLFYISSAGSFEVLVDTEGAAQQDRIVGGSQLIAIRLAEPLSDRLVLSSPVRQITHGRAEVSVESDRATVRASRAIVAVPPALAARIAYDPPLPAARDGLTQRMAQGTVIKCMAIYPEPFWRERGLSGEVTSADGPVTVAFDNSPPDGSPGVLLAFLEARAARRAGALAPEERRRAVLGCLERFFGREAGGTDRYVDRACADDEWARGCYGGFMAPGAWTDYGAALRAPVGPLHWAGAETATVWNGYMDGAISSGERAAAEALAGG